MKIKKCPRCKSIDIVPFIGFETGNYNCNKCNLIFPTPIEEEINT